MEFIEIIKKYFDYREEYNQECLFSTYGVNLKELFDKFKSLVQEKCKCTDYEYSLLCDAEHNESRFVEFMYNYFQRYLNHFPENIRDELEKINKEFYELYMKKQEIYNSYKTKELSEVAEMEKYWFLVKSKYCEVYSLLFSKEITTDKFKLAFFRKCLEWVENNEETKFKAFYQLVTSKSFMENKMSNALLEKSLQIDNVDKFFEEMCGNKSNRDYYIEPIIFGLLTSKAYYEEKITEESLEILFDENYRVIKIMIALLMFNNDYTKDKKFYSKQVQEKQNNMDLIIALLNYSKKEELCEMFESAIIPSPHSRVKNIPTFESNEAICSFNADVYNEYYSREGKIYNPLDNYFDPIGDAAIITRIADVTDGKVVLNVDVQMHYPCFKYNPIERLMYVIRDWLCTERVLPFATRPLIRTLQDK